MTKKFMVPLNGAKIRDPNTFLHLPQEGAARAVTSYYNRRVSDGDLEIRELPKKTKPKTVKPQTDGEE